MDKGLLEAGESLVSTDPEEVSESSSYVWIGVQLAGW